MIDMLVQWHIMTEDDMPEKYELDYSYKCNEFSQPVWVALSSGSIIKATRRRLVTEENFQWVDKKNSGKVIVFKSKPILWAFVPSMSCIRKLVKPYLECLKKNTLEVG